MPRGSQRMRTGKQKKGRRKQIQDQTRTKRNRKQRKAGQGTHVDKYAGKDDSRTSRYAKKRRIPVNQRLLAERSKQVAKRLKITETEARKRVQRLLAMQAELSEAQQEVVDARKGNIVQEGIDWYGKPITKTVYGNSKEAQARVDRLKTEISKERKLLGI